MLGKRDLLGKLAALQLLNAFAVSLKHRLRFEPSIEYSDLQPLISNIHTLAGEADQTALREPECSRWKLAGQALGFSFAESDPRTSFPDSIRSKNSDEVDRKAHQMLEREPWKHT